MERIKFGWAEIDITPQKPAYLAGQFAKRLSEYVEKPICATAMAVSLKNEQMIIVSCDLVSVSDNLVDAVRERLYGNTLGIDPSKVIISATHVHTGPDYPRKRRGNLAKGTVNIAAHQTLLKSMMPPKKRFVERVEEIHKDTSEISSLEEIFELLVSKITEAAVSAWKNRTYGAFTTAFGRAPVGLCRRTTFSDGSAAMWGETNQAVFEALEGGNDSGIELMYVFDENNKLSGIVANIACPAQCVQHRHFVSPDYWGEAKMLLRKRFGENLYFLELCSAAGDQCPIDLIRYVEPESELNDPNITRNYPVKRKAGPSMFDLSGMKLTGRRVANEIIAVYEDGLDEPNQNPEFIHNVRHIKLPLRRTTIAEAKEAENKIREYIRNKDGDLDYIDTAKLQVHTGIINRLEFQNTQEVIEAEAHFVRLGSIAIATNPFELFLDYGNQIRARSNAEQTFIIQLACGENGYLPTKKAEIGGHYSGFISSGLVGHTGGEQLVRETLQEINSVLFKD